ncbi:MAG: MMPL family transporter [Thermodesulfovibrionales bacterium]
MGGGDRIPQRRTGPAVRLIGQWVAFVQRRHRAVLLAALLLTSGVLLYSVRAFSINADFDSMIADTLRFRQLERDFTRAFPQMSDTIVLVVDADTAAHARSVRSRLAGLLRKEERFFTSVNEPGSGEFFEKNGLLYLSVGELEELADALAAAQPLLAFLADDLSLRGLFSVLGRAVEQAGAGGERMLDMKSFSPLFSHLSTAFEGAAANRPYRVPWEGSMFGDATVRDQRRQFVLLQPRAEAGSLAAGEVALGAVHRVIRSAGIPGEQGVTVRITGDVALAQENLAEVKKSTGLATLASLFLVGVTLYLGFGGYGRLIAASLATLLIGLIWTTGFALFAVGSLNLISITFAVLFIGLGIDYSIQFCLRYRELILGGAKQEEGVTVTAQGVGRSLLLSCITTAIGFYSFIPTAYSGVAELGLIAGTGMFISFFMNLTVLPALLSRCSLKGGKKALSAGEALTSFPYRHSRTVIAAAALLGAGSAFLLPRVYFDYNPLNLYAKTSEAVVTIKELFREREAKPWTISVLVRGQEEARRLAERLSALKEADMTLTLFDLVPEQQPEKLALISDMALFLPPGLGTPRSAALTEAQKYRALTDFAKTLKESPLVASPDADPAAVRLSAALQRFTGLLADPGRGHALWAALEKSVLSDLPALFRMLERSLEARAFTVKDLPRSLTEQYVARDGRYRVQVFPRENILQVDALARFVRSVQAVAPEATDAPVVIYESGRAVISSFQQATVSALVVITLFLLLELRSFSVVVLILIPLLFALALTGASSVALGIPLNFANVIVVPLLVGVGVHSGIIFILRYRTEPPPGGNMLRTSNARAVLFSTLTTLISTGSLAFSPHRGIASMGILLTLCFGFLLAGILLLLPALLGKYARRG